MKIGNNAWSVEWNLYGRWEFSDGLTEETAREKFSLIGERGPAKLLLTINGITEVIQENYSKKLQSVEILLKENIEIRKKLLKEIEDIRVNIKNLKLKSS
jgi:hypothetical protein